MESYMEMVQFYFNLVSSLFLGILGLFGNLMVIIVYMTRKLRYQSMSRYLVILAISDYIELVASILYNMAPYWGVNSIYCKINALIMIMFFQFCSNIITIISLDRLVSIRFLKKFEIKKSLIFQIFVLILALIMTIPISVTFFVFYAEIKVENQTSYCDFFDPEKASYTTTANLIVSTIIPFINMVTCTFFMHKTLIKMKSKLQKTKKQKSEVRREVRMFNTMIGIDFFFFICNAPICIYVIIIGFLPAVFNLLIFNALNVISIFHNTFSFIVYFVCNRVFRKEFFSIIFCIKSKKEQYLKSNSNKTQTVF
jgi:hypothetical protein